MFGKIILIRDLDFDGIETKQLIVRQGHVEWIRKERLPKQSTDRQLEEDDMAGQERSGKKQ